MRISCVYTVWTIMMFKKQSNSCWNVENRCNVTSSKYPSGKWNSSTRGSPNSESSFEHAAARIATAYPIHRTSVWILSKSNTSLASTVLLRMLYHIGYASWSEYYVVQSLGNQSSFPLGSPASSRAMSHIHLPFGSNLSPLLSLSARYIQQTALPTVPTSSLTWLAANSDMALYFCSSLNKISRYFATAVESLGSTRKPDFSC